ncbi:DUF934 domain-containing protein [Eionea flava]
MPNNPSIINNGKIVDNQWTIVDAEHTDWSQHYIIVPYDVWQKNQAALSDQLSNGTLGLLIAGDHDIDNKHEDVARFALIAIDFPAFMDGRGFSIARLLRERYQFTGELRATGAIIRDQLCYLQRCGFSSFDLAEDIDVASAVESLNDFSDGYQVSVDKPTPLFRRRA